MGDIADQVIEGLICELCLCPTDDAPGYGCPYTCAECAEDIKVLPKSGKVPCPQCQKMVKEAGLSDHIRDVHNEVVLTDINLAQASIPNSIIFNRDNVTVGILHYGPPMSFEGDLDESGRIFFESLAFHGNSLHAQVEDLKAENAKLQGNIDKVGKYIVEHERQWPYTKSCEVMFDKYGKFIEVEENE